jgi:hypothetical protein
MVCKAQQDVMSWQTKWRTDADRAEFAESRQTIDRKTTTTYS